MKSIILFRHAKSDWDATYSSDHQRPINQRGIKASKLMGSYLAKINEILILSFHLAPKSTPNYGKCNFSRKVGI